MKVLQRQPVEIIEKVSTFQVLEMGCVVLYIVRLQQKKSTRFPARAQSALIKQIHKLTGFSFSDV